MENPNNKKNWLFWGGIIVGIFVMFAGIFTLMLRSIGTAEARLILCTGLGILLGIFGSAATVKYKGLTITGVAAISISLLYVVVSLTSSQVTFGSITGDIRGALIEVRGDDTYLGAMRERNYEFVIEGSELKRPVFDVYISFPPDMSGRGEEEIIFEGINKNYIESLIGSGRIIEWRFNRKAGELIETESGKVIAELAMPGINFSAASTLEDGIFFLAGKALAQESHRKLEDIFYDLGSGSTSIRRKARDELASRGVTAVSEMMNKLHEYSSVYRIRLGILVALTEMLRKDKKIAPEVSKEMSQKDLAMIFKSLNDTDRTVRIYAGEFLYDLADPRIVPLALDAIKKWKPNSDGQYLAILAIKGVYHKLPPTEQHKVKQELRKIRSKAGPKTKQLIKSFIR